MKKILVLMMLVVGLFALAGCNDNGTSAVDSAVPPAVAPPVVDTSVPDVVVPPVDDEVAGFHALLQGRWERTAHAHDSVAEGTVVALIFDSDTYSVYHDEVLRSESVFFVGGAEEFLGQPTGYYNVEFLSDSGEHWTRRVRITENTLGADQLHLFGNTFRRMD